MPVAVAIGAAAAVVGVGISAYSMIQQKKAQDQATASQQQAIDLQKQEDVVRNQQMTLDATRRRREVVRQQIASRATAESVATNQGAEYSSALPGAYGGISGRSGENMLGVNQAEQAGNKMFGLNSQISDAYRSAAGANSQASFFQGLGSLGGMLLNNATTIGKVGSYFAPAKA